MKIDLLKKLIESSNKNLIDNHTQLIDDTLINQLDLNSTQRSKLNSLIEKRVQLSEQHKRHFNNLNILLITELILNFKDSNTDKLIESCTQLLTLNEQIYSLHVNKMEVWFNQALDDSFSDKLSRNSVNLIRFVKQVVKDFCKANQLKTETDDEEFICRFYLCFYFLKDDQFNIVFSISETAREKWLLFTQLMIDTNYINNLKNEIESLQAQSEQNLKQTKITLLLVDDEQANLDMYSQIIDSSKFSTETANSAEEAIEKLNQTTYQMIVSDLKMVDKTGMDILKHINKNKLDTKFVLQTGHGTIDLAIQAMKQGAFDFITKPIDLNQLKHIIESCRRQILTDIEEKRSKGNLVQKKQYESMLTKISDKNANQDKGQIKTNKKDDIYELFIEQFKKELLMKDALNLNQEDIFDRVKNQTGFQKSYRQFQRWVKINKGLPISDLLLRED